MTLGFCAHNTIKIIENKNAAIVKLSEKISNMKMESKSCNIGFD